VRTSVFTGRPFSPSRGSSEVSYSVALLHTRTGMAPHPYVAAAASART